MRTGAVGAVGDATGAAPLLVGVREALSPRRLGAIPVTFGSIQICRKCAVRSCA